MPAGTNVGSGVLVSPGGAQGLPGPNAVSADAGNQATFGSDSKIYVPDPTPIITSVRLRSYNAIGNPNFEVDQRVCGGTGNYVAGTVNSFQCDRWQIWKAAATGAFTGQKQTTAGGTVKVPGTNYYISNSILSLNVTTTQATLAASEYVFISQSIEGPQLRELSGDVHSISLLAYSSVALNFTVFLQDTAGTRTLAKLCSIPAGAYTLITLPSLPVWAAGATWDTRPGVQGYTLGICLGAGSSFTGAADTWQNTKFFAATGTNNWLSNAGGIFNIAFVQHEPGPLCTTFQDKPFFNNLQECKRYYAKSNIYPNKFPTNGDWRQIAQFTSATVVRSSVLFEVEMAKNPTPIVADTGTTLNAVYLDAIGTVAATPTANSRGLSNMTLGASQSPGFPYPILGQWQADTSM